MINWTNVTTVKDFLVIPETATGGYFFGSMLLLISLVTFLALQGAGWGIALMVAAFVGMSTSIGLVYMGVIGPMWTLIFVGILILTIIVLFSTDRKNE